MMRTGVSWMGHHNPKYIEADLREMRQMGLDDVLLAAQENDFDHFPGKLSATAQIARDLGLRPVAIIWGALNFFGGGLSSQFLLKYPEGFQQTREGAHRPMGCYVNPQCQAQIMNLIDTLGALGYGGYFVDEPYPVDCYCPACRAKFEEWLGGDLLTASPERVAAFRRRCVIDYVRQISRHCKANHPGLETMACLMPSEEELWAELATVPELDNLGTDIYWVNNTRDVEEMTPMVHALGDVCHRHGKVHHEWFQCWGVKPGNEGRIAAQGRILVREQPDALYVWAWQGQVGTDETCADPAAAWAQAAAILREAKEG